MFFCSLLFLLTSCGHYVSVSKVTVDRSNLASTFVRSPDPEQISPPAGEKLYITWTLPLAMLPKDHELILSIVYKDLTEEKITYPLEHRIGVISFPLVNEKFEKTKGFYAYQVALLNKEQKVIDTWQHRMWIKILK